MNEQTKARTHAAAPQAAAQSRIVVGVDGSTSARHALRWATEQARRIGAQLEVVHVWSHTPYAFVDPTLLADAAEAAARQMLRETLDTVFGDAVPEFVQAEIAEGHPARTLQRVADGAELLVVGTRGHGEVAGMFLGSVSQFLTAHASVPVVVVPGEKTTAPPENVVELAEYHPFVTL